MCNEVKNIFEKGLSEWHSLPSPEAGGAKKSLSGAVSSSVQTAARHRFTFGEAWMQTIDAQRIQGVLHGNDSVEKPTEIGVIVPAAGDGSNGGRYVNRRKDLR